MLLPANIFQPLIDVFETVLKFFHSNIGVSWGWSIVLLTVVMRLVLLPLTIKQFHSMQALQRLQPELKALQSKYKDDKQRQQQEVMKFYKENNVNPLGSCLPMVLQLPVFISLFYMLRQSLRKDICPGIQAAFQAHYQQVHHVSAAVAKGQTVACGPHGGASFLFIPDLTNKASGLVLVVLIVLYVGTQLASSLMMSTPTMDKNQRRMMMVLPLFFVIFIISFPAGLLVYWITTNAWTMGQQYVLRRRLGSPGVPAVATAGGGTTPVGKAGAAAGGRDGGSRSGTRAGGDGAKDNGEGATAPGALGSLLRGGWAKTKEEPAKTAARPARGRATAPPQSPRKKKKRSGRRR